MTSVITGDIINSRQIKNAGKWLQPLKKLLLTYGKTPATWEIYRGDSFQVEIRKPEESLLAAIGIKACIKMSKELDVRMAIGIGSKTHRAARITEANGDAFVHSGEKFEGLKKAKRSLAIRSPWPELDEELNLMMNLALISMDQWTVRSAEMLSLSLKHKNLSQKDLGEQIGRTQSSISERQTRASYQEIMELESYYRKKIKQQLEQK